MSTSFTPWNPAAWRKAFDDAARSRDAAKLHELRTEVYTHTCSCVQAGGYETEDGVHVTLPLTEDIGGQSRFYASEIHPQPACRFAETLVRAVREDCLLTAERIRALGEEVCVLNMANRQTPGGGVLQGCGAQEESLFRRSDYFRSLYRYSPYLAQEFGVEEAEEHYPMHRDFGGVFSRGVTIFRGGERKGYPLLPKPWKANFIAVAALNRPETELMDGEPRLTPLMVQASKNKIRTVLRIAVDNGQVNLVLGALGCGAFRNPPAHMAELFAEVLAEAEFRGAFKRVFFSIIEDHNSRNGGNFLPFARVFNAPSADTISHLEPQEVFVFGSNLAGHHAGGAARAAMNRFGAVWGQGVGLQGQSYAIPTMQGGVETIEPYVREFTEFAAAHPELTFLVTRIGCGIAGFRDEEIAPLFARAAALPNVRLPLSFQGYADSSIYLSRECQSAEEHGQKSARSFCLQANDYLLGINGKAPDIEKAIELLDKGIQQGEAGCYIELAALYEEGRYLPYNPEKAKNCKLHAASLGSVAAIAELATARWDAQGNPINTESYQHKLPYLISRLSQPNPVDDDDIRLHELAGLMIVPMFSSAQLSPEGFEQADMIAEKISDHGLREFVLYTNNLLRQYCYFVAGDEQMPETERRNNLVRLADEMAAIAYSPISYGSIYAGLILSLFEEEDSPLYDVEMAYNCAMKGADAGDLDCAVKAALMESRRRKLSDDDVKGVLATIYDMAQFGRYGAPDDDDLEGVLVFLNCPEVGAEHAIIPTEELNRMSGENIARQLYSTVCPNITIRNASERTYKGLVLSFHTDEGDLKSAIPELLSKHDLVLTSGRDELVKDWPTILPTGTLTLRCGDRHRFCRISENYRDMMSPSHLAPLLVSWEVGFGFGGGKKLCIRNLSDKAIRVNILHSANKATAAVDIMPDSNAEVSASDFSEPVELHHNDSFLFAVEGYDSIVGYIC